MAKAKVVNYTEEQVAEMVNLYVGNSTPETVKMLAEKFGKSTRSIIAKLSREKVYIAKPRTTKNGAPVISKAELVKNVELALDLELPSLVKAGKQDLQLLSAMVQEIIYGTNEED